MRAMKKRTAILIILTLIIGLLPVNEYTAEAAMAGRIFVSVEGNDENDGKSADKAVATITRAVELAPENAAAYICILSNLTQSSMVKIPAEKHIRIYSADIHGNEKTSELYTVTLNEDNGSTVNNFYEVYGELCIAGISFTMNYSPVAVLPETDTKSVFMLDDACFIMENAAAISYTDRAAVYVKDSTVFIYGGEITNNGYGLLFPKIYYGNEQFLYMSGGSISGNKYLNSYSAVNRSDLYVNENASIVNIYLKGSPVIGSIKRIPSVNITDTLTGEARIGYYTIKKTGTDTVPDIVFFAHGTDGYTLVDSDLNAFSFGDPANDASDFKSGGKGYLNKESNQLYYTAGSDAGVSDSKISIQHGFGAVVSSETINLPVNGENIITALFDRNVDYSWEFLCFNMLDQSRLYMVKEDGGQQLLTSGVSMLSDIIKPVTAVSGGAVTFVADNPYNDIKKTYQLNYSYVGLENLEIKDAGGNKLPYFCYNSPDGCTFKILYKDAEAELEQVGVSYAVPEGWTLYSDKECTQKIEDTQLSFNLISNNDGCSYYLSDGSSTLHYKFIKATKFGRSEPEQLKAPGINSISNSKISSNTLVPSEDRVIDISVPYNTDLSRFYFTINRIYDFMYQGGYAVDGKHIGYYTLTYDFSNSAINPVILSAIAADGTSTDYQIKVRKDAPKTYMINYRDQDMTELTQTLPGAYADTKSFIESEGLSSIPDEIPYENDTAIFTGWYTSPVGGERVSQIKSTQNSDTTLYAHWTVKTSADIRYYNHEGSEITGELTKSAAYSSAGSYTYGAGIAALPTAEPYSRVGYTFSGWYDVLTGGNRVTSVADTAIGDITLYAVWTKNPEPTATAVPTATSTPKPTATAVPTAKPTATAVPTVTPTPEPTTTPTPEPIFTPDTPTVTPEPTVTETPVITITAAEPVKAKKSDDGTYRDDEGNKVTSTIIETPKGNLAALDKEGNVVKKSVIENKDAKTGEVERFYAGSTGVIVKDDIITTDDGTRLLADENGKLITNGFATTPKGNTVYTTKTGAIVQSAVVKTDDGKQFYATKSGRIAKDAVVSGPDGKKYFATKTGELAVSALVEKKGKKYYALESGELAKSMWITVGDIMYYCNKKGIITKQKKAAND